MNTNDSDNSKKVIKSDNSKKVIKILKWFGNYNYFD